MTLSQVADRLVRRPPRRAEAPAAAVALLLTPRPRASFLLIKRAERAGDRWSGHVALPGGRREPDDADLLATAIRETAEETGIALSRGKLIGELDDLVARSQAIAVRPFVFGLSRAPKVTPNAEVAGWRWAELQALRAGAFVFGDYVVWGMTRRILEGFLERLAD